jgi:LAO/AO transport system ATPase
MNKLTTALKVLETLKQSGYSALFAGGCVRDRLLGKEPKDFDIATSATPEQVKALFAKTVPVGAHFGVMLVIESGETFEVATFRSDGAYVDGRRPDTVSYASVEEDAKRRDFTVNGLYWDGTSNDPLDLVQGQADLQKRIIRTIGEPKKRFLEDHLRLLRAIRFAVRLGFEIEPATFSAIKENASLIQSVSSERVRDELTKILTSAHPAQGIRLLDETGLLPLLLPEVTAMKGVEQPSEYHPEGDVYVHTLLLLEQLCEASPELAWGALLHDVAKPVTFDRAADRIRFHGHDRIGAEMSDVILRRLAFSNESRELICALVAQHLRFKDAKQMRLSSLKRFFSLDRFDLHMALHKIDCMASHKDLTAYRFCEEKLAEFSKLPPPPLRLVTGEDLKGLGYKPGPEFSKILRAVEDAILEGTVKTKEEGIHFVKKTLWGWGMSEAAQLLSSFESGSLRALSRLISWAENREPGTEEVLASVFLKTGKARVFGITGPPGAGKSTLVGQFVRFLREQNKKVAVIAVDPVSPFTGGALLGDRIRLSQHFNDPGVYIRSLSTRGKLGGLSIATREVVHAVDAFGFDTILIETVGVGQSEVEVRKIADATLVALVPEWGDGVQALKAGILEIGDVFAVHKADREGAERVATELRNALHALVPCPPVLLSKESDVSSVRSVLEALEGFVTSHSDLVQKRRAESREAILTELVESRAIEQARAWSRAQVAVTPNPYEGFLAFEKRVLDKGDFFS